MKNLLKMRLLGFVMAIAITSCGDGDKAPKTIDTAHADSMKADASKVKDDSIKVDKADTAVKKESVKK